MEAKYTKGPWKADVYTGGEFPSFDIYAPVPGRADTVERVVASMELANSWITAPEMVANAHLVAAAPELLEALEYIVAQTSNPANAEHTLGAWICGTGFHMATEAIAKAHGGAK